jgi:Holliday junction resolvasome RuvABC ATP-dependent DNA helicase subunit
LDLDSFCYPDSVIAEGRTELPAAPDTSFHDVADEPVTPTSTPALAQQRDGGRPEDMGEDDDPNALPRQGWLRWPTSYPDKVFNLYLDQDCEKSPFHKYIGNKPAIRQLGRIVFPAMQREDHCCPWNIALLGPSSVGKTYLAHLLVKDVLCLPLVELNGPMVKNQVTILGEISQTLLDRDKAWRAAGNGTYRGAREESSYVDDSGIYVDVLGLTLVEITNNFFFPPPLCVFIDEAHKLSKDMQHALLKAIGDRRMVTENGHTVDCSRIMWLIATTDRGDFFDAFDRRFEKIDLTLYSKSEVAQIVKLNNPRWNEALCNLIAHYCGRVPDEALKFAQLVKNERLAHPEANWKAAAARVAEDAGIDQYGLSYRRLNVLTALGQGPVSKGRCCFVAEVKEEELQRYTMPPLLTSTPGEPALVTTCSRGYAITPDGLKELDKRHIKHLGSRALPKECGEIGDQ